MAANKTKTKKSAATSPPPPAGQPAAKWRYEKGGDDNRRKHAGKKPQAEILVLPTGERVGKCPKGLSVSQAEVLLNTGIGVDADELTPDHKPSRIFIVHDGVVYRAKPTNPGQNTWHAFPEFPERLRALPDSVWAKIVEQADALGCRAQVEKWKKG